MKSEDEAIIEVGVVEHDAELRNRIVETLVPFGFRAHACGNIRDLYLRLDHHPCDLLVLDIDLPDGDGLEIIGQLRKSRELGIVVLTRKHTGDELAPFLDGSIDAFLLDPVDLRTLGQSLFSLHRRIRSHAATQTEAPRQWRLDGNGWLLRSPNGRQVPLTAEERALLILLVSSSAASRRREDMIRARCTSIGRAPGQGLELLLGRLQRRVQEYTGLSLPLASATEIDAWLTQSDKQTSIGPLIPPAG